MSLRTLVSREAGSSRWPCRVRAHSLSPVSAFVSSSAQLQRDLPTLLTRLTFSRDPLLLSGAEEA